MSSLDRPQPSVLSVCRDSPRPFEVRMPLPRLRPAAHDLASDTTGFAEAAARVQQRILNTGNLSVKTTRDPTVRVAHTPPHRGTMIVSAQFLDALSRTIVYPWCSPGSSERNFTVSGGR